MPPGCRSERRTEWLAALAMGRHEKPLDPAWPLAEFASGLRELKCKRDITYDQMAELTNYGKTVLSVAAAGRRLPTWDVTRAFVSACGGSVTEWERRWGEARDRVRAAGGVQVDG